MNWFVQKRIRFQRELFNKGFLVAAAGDEKVIPREVTDESFVIGPRVLKFFHPKGNPTQIHNMPSPEQLHRTCSLLVSMLQTSQSGIETFITLNQAQADSERAREAQKNDSRKLAAEKAAEKAQKKFKTQQRLMSKVDKAASTEINLPEPTKVANSELSIPDAYKQSPGIYVASPKHSHLHREVYLPIVFPSTKKTDQEMALYVHPWTTKTTGEIDAKIKTWVSAGCLFGSSIQGYNANGGRRPFIKHDIQFYSSEQITDIDCDDDSPYERMNAEEFERVAALIARVEGAGKKLFYHLPGLDYVVFGYEVFDNENITVDALDAYLGHVFLRIQQHTKRINDTCRRNGIEVKILSPFENLLNISLSSIDTKEAFIRAIHAVFDPLIKNKGTSKNWKSQLIDFCLQKMLSEDVVNTKQRQIWQALLQNIGRDKINTLDDLFHAANQLPLLLASEGNADCETCSVLPGTERPIQTNYATMRGKNADLPHMMFLTFADTGAGYYPAAGTKNGGLFYFHHKEEETLLNTMNATTLSAATANVRAFAEGSEPPFALETILKRTNTPPFPTTEASAPVESLPSSRENIPPVITVSVQNKSPLPSPPPTTVIAGRSPSNGFSSSGSLPGTPPIRPTATVS